MTRSDLDPSRCVATVLREGVTNLLRHSQAEHCELVLASSRHLVTMEIVNDGISAAERKSGEIPLRHSISMTAQPQL